MERDPLGSVRAGYTGFPSRPFLWEPLAQDTPRLCSEERSGWVGAASGAALWSGLRFKTSFLPARVLSVTVRPEPCSLPGMSEDSFRLSVAPDEFKTTQYRNNPEIKSTVPAPCSV